MEIDTARGILSQDLTYTYPARFDELQEAVRLGAEALKYVIRLRVFSIQARQALLPGETKPIYNPAHDAYLHLIKESPLGKEPGA